MDQDERFQAIISKINAQIPLREVELDPELTKADSFLKILRVKCYNWNSDILEKVHTLRFTVSVPNLDALNMILYPQKNLDAPIFLIFYLITKRKIICHLNVNTPSNDPAYKEKWVDPLMPILNRYDTFDCKDRYPEWMANRRHEPTIYGLFEKDRLDELTSLGFDYLEQYLSTLKNCAPVTDQQKLTELAEFHHQFREDIRTQDKAQGMMSKFIGKKKAHRIFYEVTT